MRFAALAWIAIGVCACRGDKEPPAVAVVEPAGSADPAGSAPALELPPLSADVLPRDEATPRSRAVIGEGFHFQIPEGFTRVDHASGAPAYRGEVKGVAGPGRLTFWATSEPFADTLAALVEREGKAARLDGASEPDVGPVLQLVAGSVKRDYARRMTLRFPDRTELRTLVVHDGKAYVHHCEAPDGPRAWASVGSECVTRSTTFHVAPPPRRGPASSTRAAPPPAAANVVFMGSRTTGTGRARADVKEWLESVSPYVKPCLAGLPAGTDWRVALALAAIGAIGDLAVNKGEARIADPDVEACVRRGFEAIEIAGEASGDVAVDASFVIK